MFISSPLVKAQRWRAVERIQKDDRSDQIQRIARLYSKLAGQIGRSFKDAVGKLGDSIDLDALEQALKDGRVSDAINAISEADLIDGFTPVGNAITHATIDAGQAAVAAMLASQPELGSLNIVFNAVNPATVSFLRNYEMNSIRELASDALGSIRIAVRNGVANGLGPADIATDIRDFIGLTDQQTQAVSNYRNMLQNLDSDVLTRALRDARFDPTIDTAITNGNPLTDDQIATYVDRYQSRYLNYRATTIARTEAIRAANAGNHLAWQQQVASGKMAADEVTREWLYTHDGKTRLSHVAIPLLNPDGVGLDEPFETLLGELMYPGDPSGDPADVINCRCSVFNRYTPKAEAS